MLNETFYLDGIDAASVGIVLQKPLEFEAAKPIVETIVIPGRNGVLVNETGAFNNRKGQGSCYALHEAVNDTIIDISNFLLGIGGYRRLVASDDTEHYWMARVVNGARIEQRMRTLNPFDIEFDCKPQRYLKSGETAVTFNGSGTLGNPYGFPALPTIKVYGNGAGTVSVGGVTVIIKKMTDTLILDCENMNAYNDDGNQNLNINAPVFPVLKVGENGIAFTGGVTKIEITPRWWVL